MKTTTKVLKTKILACQWLDAIKSVNISNKDYNNCSKEFNLTVAQIKTAYNNWKHFGKVDLRTTYAARLNKKVVSKFNSISENAKTKNDMRHRIKFKSYTSKEAGSILNEYTFKYKGKTVDFLLENEISEHQFYSWIKELTVSGTLLGRKIIDYKDRRKVDVLTVIRYTRYPKNSNIKNLTVAERSELNRIQYLLQKKL